MSVTTLLTSAGLKFGQDPTNARFVDDFYNAINDAQYDFSTLRSWGFLRTSATLTTTDGTRHVALPSDFGKPYDIRGALRLTSPSANAGEDIQLMSYQQWLSSKYDDGTSEGTPVYAYIQGSNIYFSPIPDAEYLATFIYYKIPTTIADSSTAITIPTQYLEGLKKMIYRRLQDAGWASIQELSISDSDIARLIGNYAKDDCRKFGAMVFNLPTSDYDLQTV